MRYTLLLHYPEETVESAGAEAIEDGQRAFASYAALLHEAGVLLSAEVLQSSASSTTLRMVDDSLRVQDGPYADTKEQLGGTFVIDVDDLDAAIDWASGAASAVGRGRGPARRHPRRRRPLAAQRVSPPATRDPQEHARAAAEQAARASYGRLVAVLAAPTRDIQLAEDALAGAFEQALRSWPYQGVPDNPEGWLPTVARNRQRDVWKSAASRTSAPLEAATDSDHDAARPVDEVDPDAIPERRLALLFVCAHPAIDEGIRTPLMLQTVLGFQASQIAGVFATPTARATPWW